MSFKPHHIALTVNDIEASVIWYKEKLGFIVKNRYNKNGVQIVLLSMDEVRLELFQFDNKTKPLPDYRKKLINDLHVVGTKHLCVEVDNLYETINRLKKNGVTFVTELDTTAFGGKYIFFKDCNGILIELYQA